MNGAAAENPNAEAQLDQMRIERDGLRVERDELKELLLRRQAEFDNFRKRTEKERSEFIQYAGMEIVREILPVVDDFERALQSGACLSPDWTKDNAPAKDYLKGVELIYQRLLDRLTK